MCSHFNFFMEEKKKNSDNTHFICIVLFHFVSLSLFVMEPVLDPRQPAPTVHLHSQFVAFNSLILLRTYRL